MEDSLLSPFSVFEHHVIDIVGWLRLGVDALGALVIAIGMLVASYAFLRALISQGDQGFGRVRLDLARYLALALEIQLAADILSTAIAPTWEEIGKLGAIAVIRTALNYFLGKEMAEFNRRNNTGQITEG